MAIPIQEDDLNGDGVIEMGETAPPVMQTTSAPAPTTPVPQPAPGAPTPPPAAASNVPPWLQQFRTAQDKRIADWRGGTDAFFGGLDKVFQGDLKGGFGQWQDYGDAQRTARRTAMDERMSKMGERFKMPEGFASKLPWGGMLGGAWGGGHLGKGKPGKPGAPGQGVAPGEPNPATPKDPSTDTPKQSAAKHGAWWAQGWGGGQNRQGKGHAYGHSKPAKQPAKPATPATSANPAAEEDDEP